MRLILQRVSSASVQVEGEIVGAIEKGLLIFVALHANDTQALFDPIIKKVCDLRIFEEGDKPFHLSVREIQGSILLVSQFTLYADCQKGRRPSFIQALAPEMARALFDDFIQRFKQHFEGSIETGRFGATMQVSLVNDGPATFIIESGSLSV